MSGAFFLPAIPRVTHLLLCGALVCGFNAVTMQAQTVHHEAFAQFGMGVAVNPMYRAAERDLSAGPTSFECRHVTLAGDWENSSTSFSWRGTAETESFSQAEIKGRHLVIADFLFQRQLNGSVVTGLKGSFRNGNKLEQDVRGREDWKLFLQSEWAGHWWLQLEDRHKKAKIFVRQGTLDYASTLGYSRNEFAMGSELRWSLFKRKRGQFRLHKIGQSRTQPAGKLVFKAAYRQWNFRDWRGGDAAHLSPNFMRTNSVSLEDGFTASPRHWLIAYGSLGYDFPVWNGVKSGLSLLWKKRDDVARLEFDSQQKQAGFWLRTEQPRWNACISGTMMDEVWVEQHAFTQAGWDGYSFRTFRLDGRAELKLNTDWRLFAAMSWREFDSDALPVGWRQRSDWTSGSVRIGCSWSRSNASLWSRKHVRYLQICPQYIESYN